MTACPVVTVSVFPVAQSVVGVEGWGSGCAHTRRPVERGRLVAGGRGGDSCAPAVSLARIVDVVPATSSSNTPLRHYHRALSLSGR